MTRVTDSNLPNTSFADATKRVGGRAAPVDILARAHEKRTSTGRGGTPCSSGGKRTPLCSSITAPDGSVALFKTGVTGAVDNGGRCQGSAAASRGLVSDTVLALLGQLAGSRVQLTPCRLLPTSANGAGPAIVSTPHF